MADALSVLGAEKFVSLTTFKKDGSAVATPMWIGRDGDHLFFWTPVDSWKAKRARNNPRVALAPCSRSGKVRDGAHPVDGVADVITDAATVQRVAGRDPPQIWRRVHHRDVHRTGVGAWRKTTPGSAGRATWLTSTLERRSPSSVPVVRQASRMSAYSVGLPKKKLSRFSRALA